ncbi:MAG: hypothetical protein ACXACY_30830, partial [Candidatus Hodarchaeales archaeon]
MRVRVHATLFRISFIIIFIGLGLIVSFGGMHSIGVENQQDAGEIASTLRSMYFQRDYEGGYFKGKEFT